MGFSPWSLQHPEGGSAGLRDQFNYLMQRKNNEKMALVFGLEGHFYHANRPFGNARPDANS